MEMYGDGAWSLGPQNICTYRQKSSGTRSSFPDQVLWNGKVFFFLWVYTFADWSIEVIKWTLKKLMIMLIKKLKTEE